MSGTLYSKKDTFWNRLRIENGLRLNEVAHYCGVSRSALSDYMNGKISMPAKVTQKLCELFDIPIKEANLQNLNLMGLLEVKKNEESEHPAFKEQTEYDPMPDIDYSEPMDSPVNSDYVAWENRQEKTKIVKSEIEELYSNQEEHVDYNQTKKVADKQTVIDIMSRHLYGEVGYDMYIRAINVIKRYL